MALEKLVGNEASKKAGQFVRDGQVMGKDEGFSAVNKSWLSRTKTWDDVFQHMADSDSVTEDIKATVPEMEPIVTDDDRFAFKYKDGRIFTPTLFGLEKIATWAYASTTAKTYTQPELIPQGKKKGLVLFDRDRGDAEVLCHIIKNGFRRIDQQKKFLFRLNTSDMTIRAMLSDQYAIVNNDWFLSVLRKTIPDGRWSHDRSDDDTIYGNVLIPDTIREEADSDYGAMLSVGNSEIGVRRISSIPSIFRAICFNGCIHGSIHGSAIKTVHKGKIDLRELEKEIISNLTEQIPLIPQTIDTLLGLRNIKWDNSSVSIKPLVATIGKEFGLDKHNNSGILEGYVTETKQSDVGRNNLFGLVNAVTRASQEFNPQTWVKMDEIGGQMLDWNQNKFDSIISRAKTMKTADVDNMFISVNV